MKIFLLLIFTLTIFYGLRAVEAASIIIVDTNRRVLHDGNDFVENSPSCNIILTGKILAGDLMQVKEVLQRFYEIETTDYSQVGVTSPQPELIFCLSSKGGLFSEAIQISYYLNESGIPTYVDAYEECSSSCAVIFFGGSIVNFVEKTSPFLPARFLHPTAKLGVHAPFAQFKSGIYRSNQVNEAFSQGVKHIAMYYELFDKLGEGRQGYGAEARARDRYILELIVRTPPNDMYYLNNILEILYANITVSPIKYDYKVTLFELFDICDLAAKFNGANFSNFTSDDFDPFIQQLSGTDITINSDGSHLREVGMHKVQLPQPNEIFETEIAIEQYDWSAYPPKSWSRCIVGSSWSEGYVSITVVGRGFNTITLHKFPIWTQLGPTIDIAETKSD